MHIKFFRMIVGFVCLLVLSSTSALARPLTITGEVAARGGKVCQVHLHVDLDAVQPPLTLSLQGTGIYSTASAQHIDPALRGLVAEKRLAVVTVDKPGIAADVTDGGARVDDAVYNRYTQNDLLACTANALQWAQQNSPVDLAPALYLSGHSEGSQVLTRFYRELALTDPLRARQVKMILLSGLPMDDWRGMLDAQLSGSNKQRFWAGFRQRSDEVLRKFGGLTYAYLAHVFAQESLRATLESLWTLPASAPLRVFQGLKDRNTPASAVMAFETLNKARQERGEPALDLHVSYYEAGHGLNAQAVNDIAAALERDLTASLSAGANSHHGSDAPVRTGHSDGTSPSLPSLQQELTPASSHSEQLMQPPLSKARQARVAHRALSVTV